MRNLRIQQTRYFGVQINVFHYYRLIYISGQIIRKILEIRKRDAN